MAPLKTCRKKAVCCFRGARKSLKSALGTCSGCRRWKGEKNGSTGGQSQALAASAILGGFKLPFDQ